MSIDKALERLRPICDVCGTRVESMDSELMRVRMTFRFRVYCHGESEECEVPCEAIVSSSVKGNRAFVRPRLEETKRLERNA